MKAGLIAFMLLISFASEIHFAEVRSCSGWKLNRLPKVKEWINLYSEKYEGVEVKFKGGDPRIIFLNENKEPVTHEINISDMDAYQIHSLIIEKGLKWKGEVEFPVYKTEDL